MSYKILVVGCGYVSGVDLGGTRLVLTPYFYFYNFFRALYLFAIMSIPASNQFIYRSKMAMPAIVSVTVKAQFDNNSTCK